MAWNRENEVGTLQVELETKTKAVSSLTSQVAELSEKSSKYNMMMNHSTSHNYT